MGAGSTGGRVLARWHIASFLVLAVAVSLLQTSETRASVAKSSTGPSFQSAQIDGCHKVVFVYAVPADGTPRTDLSGLAQAAGGVDALLWQLSKGYGLCVDMDDRGQPPLMSLRLTHTAAEIRASGSGSVGLVGSDLAQAGLPPSNLYAVFYEGFPGALGRHPVHGDVAGWGGSISRSYTPALAVAAGGQIEKTMLHEIVHSCGIGHVADDPRDLMYGGLSPGSVLDADKQDYWDHLINCPIVISGRFVKLSVIQAGSGNGNVSTDPSSTRGSCGLSELTLRTACEVWFPRGTAVTLTAQASAYSFFGGWSGACTGSASCRITMDDSAEVTATFNSAVGLRVEVLSQRVRRVRGRGRVVVAGNTCARSCYYTFPPGISVELVAVPDKRSHFVGWRGVKSCKTRLRCVVTLDGRLIGLAVTAVFAPRRHPRTI